MVTPAFAMLVMLLRLVLTSSSAPPAPTLTAPRMVPALPAVPSWRVPPLTVVPPVYEFAADSVIVPVPVLTSEPPVPEIAPLTSVV